MDPQQRIYLTTKDTTQQNLATIILEKSHTNAKTESRPPCVVVNLIHIAIQCKSARLEAQRRVCKKRRVSISRVGERRAMTQRRRVGRAALGHVCAHGMAVT